MFLIKPALNGILVHLGAAQENVNTMLTQTFSHNIKTIINK